MAANKVTAVHMLGFLPTPRVDWSRLIGGSFVFRIARQRYRPR
jgi:hypothetical protein